MEGIKRLNDMAIGQKDFVLLETVKYLTSREDMNEKYLNKEKTLKGMALYIQGEIIKEFCKKMNITNPSSLAQEVKYDGKGMRCLTVGMSEKKVFELAVNYFNKSNEELGLEKKEKKATTINRKENIKEDDEFGSIFNNSSNDNIENKKEEIEQISLFSV